MANFAGTSVVTVSATDADFGSNGDITYRIGLGSRDSFVVNKDGKVSVSNFPSFDYDDFQQLSFEVGTSTIGKSNKSALLI